MLGFIRWLELKLNSEQKVENIFVASPYCQTACCLLPLVYVGPNPFLNKIVQLITKSTSDITKAIARPIKSRYSLDCLLRLQTMGIVTNGVKNIANHNISPILSIKRFLSFVCYEMLQ